MTSPRDLIGYGENPPDPQWPGGARLALQIVCARGPVVPEAVNAEVLRFRSREPALSA